LPETPVTAALLPPLNGPMFRHSTALKYSLETLVLFFCALTLTIAKRSKQIMRRRYFFLLIILKIKNKK
jgi:hypothetical protein